jgi:hypothetical protein
MYDIVQSTIAAVIAHGTKITFLTSQKNRDKIKLESG